MFFASMLYSKIDERPVS